MLFGEVLLSIIHLNHRKKKKERKKERKKTDKEASKQTANKKEREEL